MFVRLAVAIVALLSGVDAAPVRADQGGGVDSSRRQTHETAALDASRREAAPIAGLDSLAGASVVHALDRLGIAPAELGFDKLYAEDDTFRLAVVEDLLNDPLALPRFQSDLVGSVRNDAHDPATLLLRLGALLEVEPGNDSQATSPRAASSVSAPFDESVQASLAGISSELRASRSHLERAFAAISTEQRSHILMGAPSAWGGEDDPEDRARKGRLHFEVGAEVDTTGKLEPDPILTAAAALDRAALVAAGMAWSRATEQLSRLAERSRRQDAADPSGNAGPHDRVSSQAAALHRIDRAFHGLASRITGEVVAAWPSEAGWIVLGGEGDNVYPPDVLRHVALLADLGGDDVYRGRAAGAVGGLGLQLSSIVDLAGDDLYDARGFPFALGGAVLGCAVLHDLSGDDTYLGDDGAHGAGYFGIGMLIDAGGRDRFEGRNLVQGAGAFGIGLLLSRASPGLPPQPEIEPDLGFEQGLLPVPRTGSLPLRYDENDTYVASLNGQGFASTYGVGLLLDETGNDLYRAGGRYLHAPLLPHDFQSLSQGFSIGFRPRAGGGVGLLIDGEGNDFYDAEVYAQGAGYWYSLGLLADGGGNDRYLAAQYAQGAGVHLAVGSLWDRGGDDHYVSKNGVVQGTAHDLSVALFYEESGDDIYAVSGGQGVSLTNSVALFIDAMGDDLYATYEGSQGQAGYRRGFSGAAIFLDLEGRDRYPEDVDAANAREWRSSDFAIGIDLDRDVELPTEAVPEIVLTAEDSLRAVDELFETASIWEVGSAREKVRRARLALIARGAPAVVYATGGAGPYTEGEPLLTDSGLVYRTLDELARAHPDTFAARILGRLGDSDDRVQKNVISLLGDMKWKPSRPRLEEILDDADEEEHWNRTIQALGKIGERESAPAIRPFVRAEEERRRIVVLEALKLLEDEASVDLFVEALADSVFTVRSAAISGLVALRERSIGPLLTWLGSPSPPARDPFAAVRALAGVVLAMEEDGPQRSRALEALDAAVSREPLSAEALDAALPALWKLGDERARGELRRRIEASGDPLLLRRLERIDR